MTNYAMDSNATASQTALNMNSPASTSITWEAFQALDETAFRALLGPVVEHSPWVAQRAWSAHPFADHEQLYRAMAGVILAASEGEQRALLCSHPELAGREARAGTMTADSQSEQGRLGLLALDAPTVQRIETLNSQYRERFGFPFIAALRLHATLASVLQDFDERLRHDGAAERSEALRQVCEVMRGRLNQAVSPPLPSVSPAAPPAVSTLSGSSS
ncbi:MAG: 2-oxo-4-hydroxy-4-carboxy-5-ureidoimidazoline decarboxylase [Hydrogenophaga sp.]|uniref:2-oxo-4-hydroxy-4-carboxy-5-ureidoimidazoline decarboxylase n=1 Tax=Hydrogenophaga sp. TaxID=1904254 RepID=UPI003D0A2941